MKSSESRVVVGDVIGIRLPASIVKALDAKAKAEDRPRSFIARRLIVRGLAVENASHPPESQP